MPRIYPTGKQTLAQAHAPVPTPYLWPCENTVGEVPTGSVMKITGYADGLWQLAQVDEQCLSADKVALLAPHTVPSGKLVYAAVLPHQPVPVKYDPAAANGAPAVGDTVGTMAGAWTLSTDAEGFRVVRVDTAEEWIWVLPAHCWGDYIPPHHDVTTESWDLRDQPEGVEGVEFEVLIREIGAAGEGSFVPATFDSFGHLVLLNELAPSPCPSPSDSPSPSSSTEPSGGGSPSPSGPDWPSVCPEGECAACSYDFVAVTYNSGAEECTDPDNNPSTTACNHFHYLNGSHILTYTGTSGGQCNYEKTGTAGGHPYKIYMRVNSTTGAIETILAYYTDSWRSAPDGKSCSAYGQSADADDLSGKSCGDVFSVTVDDHGMCYDEGGTFSVTAWGG